MSTQKKLMTDWRWWICSLLFVATTVNYLDRQVLSLTYEEFIKPEFHWSDANYGTITSFFSILYAIACLFAGKFVDWMGTKKGYLIAIGVWSAGAVMHAACGWATAHMGGFESVAAMRAVEAGSNAALAVATTSVYLFLLCSMRERPWEPWPPRFVFLRSLNLSVGNGLSSSLVDSGSSGCFSGTSCMTSRRRASM